MKCALLLSFRVLFLCCFEKMCILRWSFLFFFSLARCRDMPYCSGYDTWSKRTGLCTVKRKRHCYLRNDRLKHAHESSFFLWEIFADDKQSGVSYSLAACFLFFPPHSAFFCYGYVQNDLIPSLAKRRLTTCYVSLLHKSSALNKSFSN